jgi:hypothetical protein
MSKTVQGKVVRENLGPGVFLLEADDGQRYALKGGDDGLLKDGLRVAIDGVVDGGGGVGIGMTGNPVLAVKEYRVL